MIGAIPNNPLNTVIPKTNSKLKIIASDSLKIETGNLDSSLFLVFDKVNNKIIPQIPVPITHKLEA